MSKHNFDYILFDWDGCLANTVPIWMSAYKKTFASYNVFPSESDIADKVMGIWDGNRAFGIMDDEDFRNKLFEEADTKLMNAQLFSNVFETLSELKKNKKKLVLISNSLKKVIAVATKRNKVDTIFDLILCREDVAHLKPDPEGINKVLQYFKVQNTQAIMVGDSDKDVEACKNAGIASCLFYPKANRTIYKKDFLVSLKADYFIEDFRELLKIV